MAKKFVKVQGEKYSMEDLGSFFIQTRGFPSILKIGKHMGEGQSGGRAVTEIAHEVDKAFGAKLGSGYQSEMNKVIKKLEKRRMKY